MHSYVCASLKGFSVYMYEPPPLWITLHSIYKKRCNSQAICESSAHLYLCFLMWILELVSVMSYNHNGVHSYSSTWGQAMSHQVMSTLYYALCCALSILYYTICEAVSIPITRGSSKQMVWICSICARMVDNMPLLNFPSFNLIIEIWTGSSDILLHNATDEKKLTTTKRTEEGKEFFF